MTLILRSSRQLRLSLLLASAGLVLGACAAEETPTPRAKSPPDEQVGGEQTGSAANGEQGGGTASGTQQNPGSSAPSCNVPLRGDEPFVVQVVGKPGAFIRDSSLRTNAESAVEHKKRDMRYQLYFPEGRVAGAPLLVTHAGSGQAVRAVLDANLSAPISIYSSPDCGDGFKGTLRGRDDGLQGTIVITNGPSTDAPISASFELTLCPEDVTIPPPQIHVPRKAGLPESPIVVILSAPLADAANGGITLDGQPAKVETKSGEVTIRPAAGNLTPGVHDLDLSSLRDVLGRSYEGARFQYEVPKPIGAISDLSFSTAYPADAVVGDVDLFKIEDGKLVCENTAARRLVLGLPSISGATRMRFHHSVRSGFGSPTTRVQLIASDGAVTPVAISSDGSPTVIDVQGKEPFYVSIDGPIMAQRDCYQPILPSNDRYALDRIELIP